MQRNQPSIDNYIDAIIARDEGMPYADVLSTHSLTPFQFGRSVFIDLGYYIGLATGDEQEQLVGISNDESRKCKKMCLGNFGSNLY